MAFTGTPMVGQQAQAQRVERHRLGAHLWNGISTVRVNCGTAIVGSPEQVAYELLADGGGRVHPLRVSPCGGVPAGILGPAASFERENSG